ncbi:unnamed protein product [Laminaria digitata]
MSTAAVADKPAAAPSLQSMDGGRKASAGGGVGNGDAGYSRTASQGSGANGNRPAAPSGSHHSSSNSGSSGGGPPTATQRRDW